MSHYNISFSNEKMVQSIVKEGPYMIKALSLKAGEELQKHKTTNILYLQCLEGNPTITLYEPEETVVLKPHMILRIDANREHAVFVEQENTLLLLHLLRENNK